MSQRGGAVADRFEDIQRVLANAGRVPGNLTRAQLADLVNPTFVEKAAQNPLLNTTARPQNDTFYLANTVDLSAVTEQQLEQGTLLVSINVEFRPESTKLTQVDKENIRTKIVSFLQSSPTAYLRITASSAWPGIKPYSDYTAAQIDAFAMERAQAIADYIASFGIDRDRLILETRPPKFPKSINNDELRQDRVATFDFILLGR